MKVCLVSDTHGFLDPTVKKYAALCDEIWHAGDIGSLAVAEELARLKPLKAVFGNIDGLELRNAFPKNLRFNCEGMDVLITHIGGSPGKYYPETRALLNENPPGLFICGHSHILKVMYDKRFRMLYMNPGAAGNSGFHKVKTILCFSIQNATVKDLEVIEWKRPDKLSNIFY